MQKIYIKMNNMTDIRAFLEKALMVEGDVTIKKGKYVIDAKSIMGVFTIDLSTGVTVEYPANAVEFERFLKQFEV